MLNQKNVSKLITALFLVGSSAFAYAATSTTPDTLSIDPTATNVTAPAVPTGVGRVEVEVPQAAEVAEAPEAPEAPEIAEVPELPEVPEVSEAAHGPEAPEAPDTHLN